MIDKLGSVIVQFPHPANRYPEGVHPHLRLKVLHTGLLIEQIYRIQLINDPGEVPKCVVTFQHFRYRENAWGEQDQCLEELRSWTLPVVGYEVYRWPST